ncbi:putative glyoxalase superfamily protein PhnB [Mycobacterium sp. OAS707]|uniref:VOC family protein n=1 Tax=Mycobacterium sp. OAS707 TaxID=2663822 RepID=UPI00178B3004|nr:VOC family protein [Mycobacterium sp. OAS707]MBE1547864.1 putative glyoxalase superfamily protein PhnB [Mycobacterium sp. OAS707]
MNNNTDPLTVLHGDELPVQPDPEFAARLRARLESAVTFFGSQPNRTQGVLMSGTDTALAELNEPTVAPPPRAAALPYLAVANARDAIAWYVDTFGAAVVGEPYEMDDGRIGHAELAIGGGVLYLSDEYPALGVKAPAPQATSVSLMLHVSDTDATLERARERGAQVQREAYENYGGRNATIIDPFGHRWMLSGPVTGAAIPIQHGDVGYVSVWTPDADRAAAFYGHVLGWIYDPQTHEVTNTTQHIGIYSVASPQGMLCCYAVADLQGARRAILDGGGAVGEEQQFDFGTVLDATDPQGIAFAVFQPRAGEPRPALNGAGPGELSYITYEVPDSAAFRSFYSGVLFWTFEPGRIDDGWGVQQTHPMAGVAGGGATAVTVPMWTVEDIDAAVARVRQAGGTIIEEPSQQPYGKMAQCTDDQGTRFYLGEF